jgi:hypothetical protein
MPGMAAEFCLLVSLSYLKFSVTCRKISGHGADGSSPPKEIVLRISMALKNPSFLAGFEPANLGSNGKHDNHYTTEKDFRPPYFTHFIDTSNPAVKNDMTS